MTLRIEKLIEPGATVFRLVGRVSAQHVDELSKLIAKSKTRVRLDLSDVTLVDVDTIRFLGNQELQGIDLDNCSRYIREWIQREQITNSISPET